MAERDEKGFIRYTMQELQHIPSYEQRERGANQAGLGLAGGAVGTLAGAAIGSGFGPVGTALGGIAGAGVGGAAGTTAARQGDTQRSR